ncbi:MAG: Rieske 2Fe-2S domain-containing protein [Sandaracinaceae bacterium]|nr:Rieske 2Fe-2S domain-containing protein [Sandaracinaceae bacterium]
MDRTTELELIRRALARLEDGACDRGDAEEVSPVARYLDPARFAREQETLFATIPQPVAHARELAEPGDFVTLELGGAPILLTRRADGQVGAFLNVCRHRGTTLVAEARGRRKRFACPYHAWTYDLDGALVGVRHPDGFPTLPKADHGLAPVPCEERHGLVWVARRGAIDVAAHLGDALDRELATLGLDRLEPFRPDRRVWRANWKLLVEGGLEAYHFTIAHAKTIARLFTDNVFLADAFGRHSRLVLVKKSLAELAGADESTWSLRAHANVLYSLFPNGALLVQPDHVAWIAFRPLAIDETEVAITMLVPPGPRSESEERHWEKNHALTLPTLAEDFAIGESIQRSLRSGANDVLRFGRYEHLLGAFHRALDDAMR